MGFKQHCPFQGAEYHAPVITLRVGLASQLQPQAKGFQPAHGRASGEPAYPGTCLGLPRRLVTTSPLFTCTVNDFKATICDVAGVLIFEEGLLMNRNTFQTDL